MRGKRLRPPDHWRSTQVTLILDKLAIPANARVKGPVRGTGAKFRECGEIRAQSPFCTFEPAREK
jgi:hypothetical protein